MAQSPEDKKRDEVLKRMLQTPPKPNEKKRTLKENAKNGRVKGDAKKG